MVGVLLEREWCGVEGVEFGDLDVEGGGGY
jgi:hypothetical protein